MDFLSKAKGFLSEPSRAFESARDEAIEEAMKYYLFIAAVYSLLSAIMYAIIYAMVSPVVSKYDLLTEPHGIAEIFSDFFMSLMLMIIGVFIWGVLLHIFVYILGGRKEITRTLKAVIYGSTPLVLMGWIPLIGIFGWIWLFALHVVGIQQYQEISTGRAIASVMIPIILIFMLAIVLLVVISTVIAPFVMSGGFSG